MARTCYGYEELDRPAELPETATFTLSFQVHQLAESLGQFARHWGQPTEWGTADQPGPGAHLFPSWVLGVQLAQFHGHCWLHLGGWNHFFSDIWDSSRTFQALWDVYFLGFVIQKADCSRERHFSGGGSLIFWSWSLPYFTCLVDITSANRSVISWGWQEPEHRDGKHNRPSQTSCFHCSWLSLQRSLMPVMSCFPGTFWK